MWGNISLYSDWLGYKGRGRVPDGYNGLRLDMEQMDKGCYQSLLDLCGLCSDPLCRT